MCGYFAARHYTINEAQGKAKALIAQVMPQESVFLPDEEVIALTKTVFETFREREPSEVWQLKLRSYVTNKRLPEGIKFPEGAIEAILQQGMCDNAARMLKFVLAEKGYNSVQWNMVTNGAAHTALLVDLPDGRKGYVDPFFGYVAVQDGKLISLLEAHELVHSGKAVESVLQAFRSKKMPILYQELATMAMAGEGDFLTISAKLPIIKDGKPIHIGDLDGNAEDVKNLGGSYGMTLYWGYVGHKYNREWVRELMAPQDVRLEMILLEEPEKGVLTAEPKPQIEGKTLRWNLKAGDKITFRDGLAKISWKRMNSYIGVDQIVITPLN